ncbi:MAG: WecB/TagA/CpsF family glycosyltransferase [Balneola sp.]|nr:WecB/TagA/CpsF family glycosyltransferase [Balneola sp.]MBO6650941.1 WecB/TagA/CpsF family glycosyltransferase [Balneola sp.]MBO6711883.1 WecB/TagA/CpsF family glycosyltransferase [Balneola sp.]MBO6800078.1 WecB/TagA/CpsF family glycosyltransferase [Balneola sp.]MBO6871541.1 WecB/TagA/CpsF family glycosyltransferase [Balneola sp.]
MIGVESRFYIDVRVDNLSLDTALERVETLYKESSDGVPRQIFFTNVHSVHLANQNPLLKHDLNEADLVLPDGSGLKIAGKVLNKPVEVNLNGTDFTPKVFRMAEVAGWSVYLLGAKKNVITECVENISKRFSKLEVKGYHNGFFDDKEEKEILKEINQLKPDILLVALGSPFQERWIAKNAVNLDTRLCFAVGGLFDFLSNQTSRAPLWMRKIGCEWVYRFIQNPKEKWDRIFVEIPLFLYAILHEKIRSVIPRGNFKKLGPFNG